jgi:ribosomal protein L7/L12
MKTATIIAACQKINLMCTKELQDTLLKLLEDSPTKVCHLLGVGEIPIQKKVIDMVEKWHDEDPYKQHGSFSWFINTIKAYRHLTGAGLAESKAWAEKAHADGRLPKHYRTIV